MRKFIEKTIFNGKAKQALPMLKKKALKQGIFLASIAPLYKEIAKGNISGFSVPAFNIRTLTFDVACSIFKAAKKSKASAFILEIAKSEIEYTKQNPEEFALCVLAGAIKEKYRGPIFLQGDHFHLKDTTHEAINNLEALISRSLEAGFYNFDIDCSALGQENNLKYTNYFVEFIKKNQPQTLEAALGGEVSSIGGEETTKAELEDFLKKVHYLTKASCQTGTRHGGKVLPSGLIDKVEIDFENIKHLNETAKQYGLAGIVQHGASTLQESQFEGLAKAGVLEVHLSTLFTNIIFDSQYFPKDLKEKIYSWLDQGFASQKKNFKSEIQFTEILRKKSFGDFKKDFWEMPQKNIKGISLELEEKFLFFFKVFCVGNTRDLIKKIYN